MFCRGVLHSYFAIPNHNNTALLHRMDLILLQSEAFIQLQQNAYTYMRKLMEDDRKKSTIEWLDNSEAAKLLKVSKRTMQSWRDEGILGFSQVGSKIYYNREEIDRMLLKHHNKPFRAVA